jgi:hypothetical protein
MQGGQAHGEEGKTNVTSFFAVSSVSPSAIHSPQFHHPDDVQAGMLVSSQQTLMISSLSFVKYINYYVSCVFGCPQPVNHVTDLNLHFTGLLL